MQKLDPPHLLALQSAHRHEAIPRDTAAVLFIAFPTVLRVGQPGGEFSAWQETAECGVGKQRAAVGVDEGDTDREVFEQRIEAATFCINGRKLVADLQLLLPGSYARCDGTYQRFPADGAFQQDDAERVIGQSAPYGFAGSKTARLPPGEQYEGNVRPCRLRRQRAVQGTKVGEQRFFRDERDARLLVDRLCHLGQGGADLDLMPLPSEQPRHAVRVAAIGCADDDPEG